MADGVYAFAHFAQSRGTHKYSHIFKWCATHNAIFPKTPTAAAAAYILEYSFHSVRARMRVICANVVDGKGVIGASVFLDQNIRNGI